MAWAVRITGPGLVLATCRELLQVRAGAEMAAGTSQNGDGLALGVIELPQRFGERCGGFVVQGVTYSRTIDCDDRDRSVVRDQQRRIVRHARSASSGQ